ncbi:MAG: redox-sensing transcriptional repressor Rex [Elusimicrobia bacterium]|nr:redox-sensing transcriptional repressor Rex [Elusimicrobiota bacterium]
MLNRHTVERLVIYNRVLKDLAKKNVKWATSEKIAEILFRSPAQVRKDLSFLGKKGKPGVGYNIRSLIGELDSTLGLRKTWGVALIGAGNLGRALFHYPGFKREGFEFRAIFDNNSSKIGRRWGDITVTPITSLNSVVRKRKINIAVMTVPDYAAQEVADKLTAAGLKELLNFAPVTLNVADNVNVRYADLALELENLSYNLNHRALK